MGEFPGEGCRFVYKVHGFGRNYRASRSFPSLLVSVASSLLTGFCETDENRTRQARSARAGPRTRAVPEAEKDGRVQEDSVVTQISIERLRSMV